VYFGNQGLSVWNGQEFFYDDLLTAEERAKNTYPPRVNALFTDGESVWVGATNGLFEFRQGSLKTNCRESVFNLDQYSTSVGVITAYPEGDGLLVGVGSSLYQFAGGKFVWVLSLPSEIRTVYAMPNALMVGTASSGLYSVPKDGFGIYWDWVSSSGPSTEQYGYQAVTMSDVHTLWIASSLSGLQRSQALYGQ
jgi:hypothetical protein